MDLDSLSGHHFGRYEIKGPLGEGGMAVVYRAFDSLLDRQVAIKVLKLYQIGRRASPAATQGFLKRFEREAHALARLQHPNIVPIIDYGSAGENYPYLVMPLLLGGTLADKVGRPMHFAKAAQFLAPVAAALAYAHRLGMLHRDIKPNNILLAESGDPLLADFGLVRFMESESISLTASGAVLGTPMYMAPEQWKGEELPQTDIFALGMVFYELVTGHNPYIADTPQQIMYKQLMEPLPSPRQDIPSLPSSVEETLLRALAREPADRYPNMQAFAALLRQFASGPAAAFHDSTVVSAPDAPHTLKELPRTNLEDPLLEGAAPTFVEPSPPGAGTVSAAVQVDTLPRFAPFPRAWMWGAAGAGLLVMVSLLVWGLFFNHPDPHAPLVASSGLEQVTLTLPAASLPPTATVLAAYPAGSGRAVDLHPTTTAARPPVDTPIPTPAPLPSNPLILWDSSHGPRAGQDGVYDPSGVYSGLADLLSKEKSRHPKQHSEIGGDRLISLWRRRCGCLVRRGAFLQRRGSGSTGKLYPAGWKFINPGRYNR